MVKKDGGRRKTRKDYEEAKAFDAACAEQLRRHFESIHDARRHVETWEFVRRAALHLREDARRDGQGAEEAESRIRLADDEIEQAYMDLGFWTDAYAATRTACLRNLDELETLEAEFGAKARTPPKRKPMARQPGERG
ncbi:MAG: hypothetical protein ACI4QF_02030 [Kiritimatiellia bacterium]